MLVLVGFMGAGKSTVGRLIAARCGLKFLDSDAFIEARSSRTIADIFAAEGEPYFRELEHQAVAELLGGSGNRDGGAAGDSDGNGGGSDLVVSLGGGAVEDERSQHLLRRVPVVYLQVSYDNALARVGGDRGRPMLARADLAAVYQRRAAIFARLAVLTVATDGIAPADVAQAVIAGLVL